MNILAIDTSTTVLGVGIQKDGEIIGELSTNIQKTHTPRLMPAIHDLMKRVHMKPEQLDKIVIAKGPGSYTGVRIGLTTAKSLAWALDIPIISVSSLEALAYQGRFFPAYICPFFDARRKTVFTGLYQQVQGQLTQVQEETNVLMEDWLQEILKYEREVLFLSPQIDQFTDLIAHYFKDQGIIPEKPYHFTKPAHLLLASSQHKPHELHTLTPNYLRLAEAEANWIKTEKKKQ